MAATPLLPIWLIVTATAALGIGVGILFERARGPAAKRAAKFEADLVQARSDLMRYQEETKRHFGKSAELLGRMATDYREFLHHFVSGAEELCGPNLKELDASGLERPLLDGATTAPVAASPVVNGTTFTPPIGAPTVGAAAITLSTPAVPPLDSDPLIEDAAAAK
jgi:uncharacterized membrane-anchored protein YhcB (DUF1043 family)